MSYMRYVNIFLDFIIKTQKAVDRAIKALGPFFVLLATCITSFIIYIYFTAVLPYYFGPISYWGLNAFLHFIPSIWVSFAIYYYYFASILTNPGNTPMSYKPSNKQKIINEIDGSYVTGYCKKCKMMKPDRAHHCSLCNRCVLKMDHHCPWLANCVGHWNHHYFLLYLLYTFIGTLYSSILLSYPFILSYNDRKPWNFNSSDGSLIASFVLSLSVCLAVGLLFFWQFYLMLTNQTTIEFYENSTKKYMFQRRGLEYVNPYNLGIEKNFAAFFGIKSNDWWFKWLVPSMSKPIGNGLSYPKVNQGEIQA